MKAVPIQDIRSALETCDNGCPNEHYTKYVCDLTIELKGHPLVCHNDGGCSSMLRILRAAANNFPALATLLRHVYRAIGV